jgi:hypothetical protein
MIPAMPRPTTLAASLLVLGAALGAGVRARADDPPAGPRPRLAFDRLEHDFGIHAQEQEVETQFTAKNEGDAPLKITRVQPDCGCYDAAFSATTIKPGQTSTLAVRFRTLVFSGPVTKRIRVFSNDPAQPEVVVKLRLDIVAGVIVDPGRIYFGDVLAGTLPSATMAVKWYEGIGPPFELKGIEVLDREGNRLLGEGMEAKTERFADEKWKGFRVAFTFKKAPPLGMFSATAVIRTDREGYARIDVPLTGVVSGKMWVQARDLYLGWVRQGQAKTRPLKVRPFKEGIQLGNVTAAAKNGRVKVEAVPDADGARGLWIVNITVPADAPPGMLEDVVQIRCEVPGEPVTEVPVRAEVMKIGD